VGSGLGLAGASLAMQLLRKLIPADMMSGMPYLQGLGLNGRVILFACLLSLGAAVLFSIVPMLRLRRNGAGLSVSGRGFAGTLWRRMGSNLVVIELATAMVLLVAAGLLGKSFYRLLHTELGMEPDHLAMLRIVAPRAIDAKDEQLVLLAKTVVDRIGSLPGVQSVGLSQGLPVGESGNSSTFEIVGRPAPASPNEEMVRYVDPGYFTTLRTRLLRGRYFQANDDATRPPVVILNQAMVKRYFPTEDPLGRRIVWDASSPQMEVVGVVDDIKEGPLDKETSPSIYLPFAQNPHSSFYVLVRTAAEERSLLPEMTAAIHEINPGLITLGGDTMTDRINSSSAAYLHRCSAILVGSFAALALVLAIVGLYGVIAYSVGQRTREIGVRMALGAHRGAVYAMVLKEAGWLVTVGLAVGLASSVAAATLMRSLLFGTQAWDAPTLTAVAAVLAIAALLASYIPARRAASVNPVEALRAE
jgi:predicted permease